MQIGRAAYTACNCSGSSLACWQAIWAGIWAALFHKRLSVLAWHLHLVSYLMNTLQRVLQYMYHLRHLTLSCNHGTACKCIRKQNAHTEIGQTCMHQCGHLELSLCWLSISFPPLSSYQHSLASARAAPRASTSESSRSERGNVMRTHECLDKIAWPHDPLALHDGGPARLAATLASEASRHCLRQPLKYYVVQALHHGYYTFSPVNGIHA